VNWTKAGVGWRWAGVIRRDVEDFAPAPPADVAASADAEDEGRGEDEEPKKEEEGGAASHK
jgi:hypothetical protein